MAFPDEMLADGEQTLLVTSPHGSEVLAPLIWLLVVVPCGGVLIADLGEQLVNLLAVMAALIGFGSLLVVMIRALHWQSTLYAITNHRVIVREGVLSRDNRDVPLSVIQDVRIQQGWIARVFKAGDLQLQSAAVRGHTRLRWLPQVHEVRRLVNQLVQDGSRPDTPPATAPAAAGSPPPGDQDLVGQLQRLSDLHVAGHLTDEEFEAAKRRLLGGQDQPPDDDRVPQ